MAKLDPEQIQNSMRRLSDAPITLFGADSHRFVLNPPLTDDEILAFEQLHQIALPADYRYFLSRIGNGGAGPYYGVFPLGQMDGSGVKLHSWREGDGFVGVLSKPFPLRDAWKICLDNLPQNLSMQIWKSTNDSWPCLRTFIGTQLELTARFQFAR